MAAPSGICTSPSLHGTVVLVDALTDPTKFHCRKETRQDTRTAWLHHLGSAPLPRLMGLLLPRLFDLCSIEPAAPGEPARIPHPIGIISAARLLADGIYLLENGSFAYIYIGGDASSDLQRQLIGTLVPLSGQLVKTFLSICHHPCSPGSLRMALAGWNMGALHTFTSAAMPAQTSSASS